jgi:hypothetical protein
VDEQAVVRAVVVHDADLGVAVGRLGVVDELAGEGGPRREREAGEAGGQEGGQAQR